MATLQPPTIGTIPTPPDAVNRQSTFHADAVAMFTALKTVAPQIDAVGQITYENAVSVELSAAIANALPWASGTYSMGAAVWSPASLADGVPTVYIRKEPGGASPTDPANDPANWVRYVPSNTTGGAVYTTSTTLTSGSPFAISVSGGRGVWLKLPDATTMSKGIAYTVRNTGDSDLTVLDSTGLVIGFIRPQCGTTIALSDSSTAAGKWVGDWEIYGLTADLSLGVSISSGGIFSTAVKINQNKTMFLYGQTGGGLYSVVYDTATQTATDSLLVRAASSQYCQAMLIGENVAVMTCDNGTSIQVALISPACTLLSTASASASGTVNSFGQFIALGAGYVFSYKTSTAGIIRAISVSGTTLSIGSEVSLVSAESPRLYINGGYLLALRHNNSNGIYCTAYTLSGNTLTAGNSANSAAAAYSSTGHRSFQLDNGDVCVTHIYSYNLVISVFKLSGTSLSAYSSNIMSWSNANISCEFFAHIKLAGNRVAVAGMASSATNMSCAIVSSTSGAPSISSISTLSSLPNGSIIVPAISGFLFGTSHISFDFSGVNPLVAGVGRFTYDFSYQGYYGLAFDLLSNFGENICKSSSIMLNLQGDLSFNSLGVCAFIGRSSIDSPQKIKPTFTKNPNFTGESINSVLSVYPIASNNYGFRILRITCID